MATDAAQGSGRPGGQGGGARTGTDAAQGVAVDCGEWACWPMPNSPRSGLPNPARYDASRPDVVIDLVTGLMWQRAARSEAASYVEEDIPKRCSGLRLGGHEDWRVPRLIELISLIDFASEAPPTGMKVTPELADTGFDYFWSSTSSSADKNVVGLWLVQMNSGGIDAPSGFAKARTRCVRTHVVHVGTAQHHLVQGSAPNHTVRDNWTGLTWQGVATGAEYTFAKAKSFCSNLSLSAGGWRVPTAGELLTLIGRQNGISTVDKSVFPDGAPPQEAARLYWTSTPDVLYPTNAYFVDFQLGTISKRMVTGGNLVDQMLGVRCVR